MTGETMMSKVIRGVMTCGGEIRRISSGVRNLLGMDPYYLKGMPATHLFREDDAFMIGLAGARLDKGRREANIFLEVRRVDGDFVRMRAKVKPRYARGGRSISGYDFSLTPIDDQKRKRRIRTDLIAA